jgi:hypothetical protein
MRLGLAEEEHALPITTAPTLYIFTNIDQLDVDGVAVLSAFLVVLAESSGPVSVAATLSVPIWTQDCLSPGCWTISRRR